MDTSGFFVTMKGMKYVVKSPEGMSRVARALLLRATHAKEAHAYVVGLSGELGAGKTTFTKRVARELGIKRNIVSPTFILERDYKIPRSHPLSARFSRLIHVDAYRLTEHDALFSAHLRDIMEDPHNLILIEWPERIKAFLPKGTLRVLFAHKDENTRIVTVGV